MDHLIPHTGGGADTETLENMKVACSRCNLKKGKGYSEAAIRLGLKELVQALAQLDAKRSLVQLR